MSDLVVRPARPSDARGIATVHVRAWQEGYANIAPREALDRLSVADREAMWDRILDALAPERPIWVGERDDTVLGFGQAGPARGDDLSDNTGELIVLNVDPSAWRTGVGSAILGEATDFLRAGRERGVLWVAEANERGRAFYERHGWAPDGARRREELFGITFEEIRYRTSF